MTMLGATRVRRPTPVPVATALLVPVPLAPTPLTPVPLAPVPLALPLPFTPLADDPPSPGGRNSSYWPRTREDRYARISPACMPVARDPIVPMTDPAAGT